MVLGVYAIGYICAQKASVAGCDRQKESEQDEFHTTKTEVLVTQPAALDVPSEVQQLLQRYVKETTALLGSQLEGIVLYGSAVRGEFLPGRSNINLLLMVSGYDREGLKRYAKTHKRWSREQFVVPLVLTEPELTRPGLVFPLEYLEIQEQHRVLWGRDPFIGLHIDRTHLAYQVRQGLHGNLVRLRQRFIEGGGTEEAIAMLLPLSLTALLPCLQRSATIGRTAAVVSVGRPSRGNSNHDRDRSRRADRCAPFEARHHYSRSGGSAAVV